MVKGSPDALRASRTPAAQYTGGVAAWNEPPSNPSQVVTMWNGMESLVDPLLGPFWGSTFANQLNGTLGSSYYTDMKMNVKYPVFVDDLFRSVYLTATTSITYQGAGLYRYTIDQSSFVSEKVNPDNAAFYIQDTGFIARPPQKQQPVWISKARFLHCNMSAVKMSIIPEVNVDANWESYDVAIDVEPITGQVFQAHKRYQINTRFVQGLTVPPTLPKLVETYYPVLWIDYHTALPRRETDLFVNSVVVPKRAVRISTIIGMTIGSLLLMGALVRMVRAQQQQGDSPVAHEDSEVINARKTLVPAEEDGVNNAKRISTVKYT
jgi:hypothetical protein